MAPHCISITFECQPSFGKSSDTFYIHFIPVYVDSQKETVIPHIYIKVSVCVDENSCCCSYGNGAISRISGLVAPDLIV